MLRHPLAPTPTVLKITHFLLRCIFNNKISLTAGRNINPPWNLTLRRFSRPSAMTSTILRIVFLVKGASCWG